jgi:hypothetical protein
VHGLTITALASRCSTPGETPGTPHESWQAAVEVEPDYRIARSGSRRLLLLQFELNPVEELVNVESVVKIPARRVYDVDAVSSENRKTLTAADGKYISDRAGIP